MRLSILWRIMEIKEGAIRRGRSPRRITPSVKGKGYLTSVFSLWVTNLTWKYSGTPLIRPPLGHKILVVITRWSYKRGGRKAGFHCRLKPQIPLSMLVWMVHYYEFSYELLNKILCPKFVSRGYPCNIVLTKNFLCEHQVINTAVWDSRGIFFFRHNTYTLLQNRHFE